MLLSINKTKIYFYIFSLLFLTTIINFSFFNNLEKNFLVKTINIKTNNTKIDEKIFLKLSSLIDTNIFSLNEYEIYNALKELNYLENIQIIKKYPSSLNIQANVTNIIGKTYKNQKKFFVGSNGNFISSIEFKDMKEIPIIFGDFKISDYIILNSIIEKSKISKKNITKYYYHKNKRWDLYYSHNVLIKLPNKNISNSLKLFKQFKEANSDLQNIIIDLRVPKRMIVKNEQR